MKKIIFGMMLISGVAIVALLMDGCAGAKKQIESQPVEAQVATPVPTQVPMVDQIPLSAAERYTVVPKDTLWAIAANHYADPFQWPLILKANRDKIKDPHWIYPKQVFKIERGMDDSAVALARSEAKKYHEKKRVKSSK